MASWEDLAPLPQALVAHMTRCVRGAAVRQADPQAGDQPLVQLGVDLHPEASHADLA